MGQTGVLCGVWFVLLALSTLQFWWGPGNLVCPRHRSLIHSRLTRVYFDASIACTARRRRCCSSYCPVQHTVGRRRCKCSRLCAEVPRSLRCENRGCAKHGVRCWSAGVGHLCRSLNGDVGRLRPQSREQISLVTSSSRMCVGRPLSGLTRRYGRRCE